MRRGKGGRTAKQEQIRVARRGRDDQRHRDEVQYRQTGERRAEGLVRREEGGEGEDALAPELLDYWQVRSFVSIQIRFVNMRVWKSSKYGKIG
jgi:hypothetical protein